MYSLSPLLIYTSAHFNLSTVLMIPLNNSLHCDWFFLLIHGQSLVLILSDLLINYLLFLEHFLPFWLFLHSIFLIFHLNTISSKFLSWPLFLFLTLVMFSRLSHLLHCFTCHLYVVAISKTWIFIPELIEYWKTICISVICKYLYFTLLLAPQTQHV